MAELDFAVLAEFARLDGSGALTLVGAGFVRVTAPGVPAQQLLSVPGRVFVDLDEPDVPLGLVFRDRDGKFRLSTDGVLSPDRKAALINGRWSVSFVATQAIPIPAYGYYDVELSVNGELVRTLTFEVVPPDPAP